MFTIRHVAFIFGVVPLVVATGAGAEMHRSLGQAVFAGMLGMTLFGIFQTPVSFYVIQGREEMGMLFAGSSPWSVEPTDGYVHPTRRPY